MTVWQIIILASIAVLAIKLVGYLIPPSLVERPTPARIANLLTVALLAALITVQTLGVGQGIQIDARVPALIVAAGLFALRVPFILVVIAAAVVATRALGAPRDAMNNGVDPRNRNSGVTVHTRTRADEGALIVE